MKILLSHSGLGARAFGFSLLHDVDDQKREGLLNRAWALRFFNFFGLEESTDKRDEKDDERKSSDETAYEDLLLPLLRQFTEHHGEADAEKCEGCSSDEKAHEEHFNDGQNLLTQALRLLTHK